MALYTERMYSPCIYFLKYVFRVRFLEYVFVKTYSSTTPTYLVVSTYLNVVDT